MDLLLKKPNNLKFGNFENYEIISLVGKGKHSYVYKGYSIKDKKICAIKIFKDIKENRIFREINILNKLKNEENIPKIIDILYDNYTCTYSLVMDFFEEMDYIDIKRELGINKIKKFMLETLKILNSIHKNKIIHRDIKPQNILFDKINNKIKIIDFSHSCLNNNESKSCKPGCFFYNAPELLFGLKNYDEKVDIWSLGCIFFELLSNKRVLFYGKSKLEQLEQISEILGTKGLYELCKSNKIDYSILNKIKLRNKINFREFKENYFNKKINDDGIDLLEKMLEINNNKRISTAEALKHPYFKK